MMHWRRQWLGSPISPGSERTSGEDSMALRSVCEIVVSISVFPSNQEFFRQITSHHKGGGVSMGRPMVRDSNILPI